jgi:ABC-type branched-subunit amino acid transport system ATPase component
MLIFILRGAPRALAGHPKLLLLDEPAARMNPEEGRERAPAA